MTEPTYTKAELESLELTYDKICEFRSMFDRFYEYAEDLSKKSDKLLEMLYPDAAAILAERDRATAERAYREALEAAEAQCERVRTQKANGPMPEGACFDYEQSINALPNPYEGEK